ncbi:hypothetical protein FHW88_002964 [Mucilaginibacter sp. SG538B]|uniref:glycosyltransferase family 39 protein n=1 Tax=Mucilaginibacter sp. SG538B TaxID=2587021 RepID=UPI00159E9B79|nr:glycosyltransferase family 39 protein [Mucilaginibacter sp. SG538B]NVM64675.1 hypothetical protein [Mucilaginibacter sp. SG538B]
MPVLLLFAGFILIFFSLGIYYKPGNSRKEILLISIILFSVLIVFITELLSSLHRLNFLGILISWGLFGVINAVYLYLNKNRLFSFINNIKLDTGKKLKTLTKLQLTLMAGIALMLILIFIQGIIYPPNNWDSMTYHLARITSWVSHQSVDHYATDITRQLYQPPFAEYVIMHINLLSGGDYLSNAVQFFYFLFVVLAIVLIIEKLGLGREYKIAGILLTCTVPEVILQASSTQNDVVISLFVISALYFAIEAAKTCKLKHFIFFGFSIGLSVFTKGTGYLYLTPIILFAIITVVISFSKTFKYNYLWFSLVAVMCFLSVNAGHYSRNYKLWGNILGLDKQESKEYSNQKMNAGFFLSNCIKNAGLHLCLMYVGDVAQVSDSVIYKFHRIVGIDINDPAVNYRNNKFSTKSPVTNEDTAPNMLHFIFSFAAFMMLVIQGVFSKGKKMNQYVIWLMVIIMLQVSLFCLYLKWQPWHSRLHIPFFLLSIPLICSALNNFRLFKKLFNGIVPLFLVYALLVVLHNSLRPYTNIINQPRYQQYFVNKPESYKEYNGVYQSIKDSNYSNIGINLGIDDWQYPLFKDCFSRPINPIYVNVANVSNKLYVTPEKLDCIVSTIINKPYMDFNGRRFYNQSVKNKIIFLYK